MTLEGIRSFQISEGLVQATEDALREAGSKEFERFVLWSGRTSDKLFRVEHIYVPTQRSFKLKRGVCVRVEAPELDRLNRWLYANHQELAIQVHSHPNEAYHSETDDTFPIVTLLGGLSIVVPNFCRDELFGYGIAVFRLTREGWVRQADDLAHDLVQVAT